MIKTNFCQVESPIHSLLDLLSGLQSVGGLSQPSSIFPHHASPDTDLFVPTLEPCVIHATPTTITFQSRLQFPDGSDFFK